MSKTVLILGASRGIGLGLAREFLERGWKVVASERDRSDDLHALEGENLRITGIPNFAPEILRRVRLGDPMRMKQLRGALGDLAEEGVTQVFRPRVGAQWIVGVVGQLQLDVLISRIQNEYQVAVDLEAAPYETARWLTADEAPRLKEFEKNQQANLADDRDGYPVFLARNAWELDYIAKKWPNIRFNETRERG